MNLSLLLGSLAVVGIASAIYRYRNTVVASNALDTGTHARNALNYLTDGAIGCYRLVKIGSVSTFVDVCGANDSPLGISQDEASEANDLIAVHVLGCGLDGTQMVIASGSITAGAEVYTAAAGAVSAKSKVSGTYYKIGKALQAAADGDLVEIVSCYPELVTV